MKQETTNKLSILSGKYYIWLLIISLIIIISFVFLNLNHQLITQIFDKKLLATDTNKEQLITKNTEVSTEDNISKLEPTSTLSSLINNALEIITDQPAQNLTKQATYESPADEHVEPNSTLQRHDTLEPKRGENYIKILGDYRRYLINAQNLIINFLQDKPYTHQLDQLNIEELPQEIKVIIVYFIEYNKNYLADNNEADYEKIFPINSRVIEQVVKITKKSDKLKSKEILRQRIISNLEIFVNFIYSEEAQNILMNRDR